MLSIIKAVLLPSPKPHAQKRPIAAQNEFANIQKFALDLISDRYDFKSEDKYLNTTTSLCELAQLVAVGDGVLSDRKSSNPKLQLVVNNDRSNICVTRY